MAVRPLPRKAYGTARRCHDRPMVTSAPDEGDVPAATPESTQLLLDVMLGTLAVYLRMAGYDAAYAGDRGVEDDDRLLAVAATEGRLLLSRDRSLIDRADRGFLLTERDVEDQLTELRAAGFALDLAERPTRCGRCNGLLEPLPPNAERPDYAPARDEFDCWRCVDCGQVFWRGSHWDRVRDRLEG